MRIALHAFSLILGLCLTAKGQPTITSCACTFGIVDQVFEYRYPIIYTNCNVRLTNLIAYGQSYGSITVTWLSSPGTSYAVESSHSMILTTLPGNVYVGDAWEPVSLPVTATSNETRWTGGLQSEQRFFRIRELREHEKDCDCCFLWEWMRP